MHDQCFAGFGAAGMQLGEHFLFLLLGQRRGKGVRAVDVVDAAGTGQQFPQMAEQFPELRKIDGHRKNLLSFHEHRVKNGTWLRAGNADHGVYAAAFLRGEVADTDLVRSEQGNQSLCGHCGTGHQPVAAKLFHRCAGKQRLQCGSTAHNDRRTGKGVGEVVSGVGKSVQHQAAFAQPQKDLKPAVGVAFPAAEQGAEMQQRICRGSE